MASSNSGVNGAFDRLSRVASRESGLRAARRAAWVTAVGLCVAALSAAALLDAYGGTNGARRYQRAVAALDAAAPGCDAPLGTKHFLGRRPVVGVGTCISHDAPSRTGNFPDAELRFFVVGDWGRDGMCCQRDVAQEMAVTATNFTPAFVANVGDSFYPKGLRLATDVQVDTSWRDVYIRPHLSLSKILWKSVAGNHDYMGNVDSQIALSKLDSLWHFPSKYYFEEAAGGEIFMAFLDTTPLYYDEGELDKLDESGADAASKSAAAQQRAHRKAVRDLQISALSSHLAASSARVKLVFGHHPLFSSAENALTESAHLRRMNEHLMGILSHNNVSAYFSGHEHTMEHTVKDNVHFFVIGTGSKVNPIQMRQAGSVFALGRQGFMSVAVEAHVVHVQFVDFTGHVVHAASIGRNGVLLT